VKDEQAFLARVKKLYDNPYLKDHCKIELKDGRTLERHSSVLRNNDGVYLGRVWFFCDVSPQEKAESTPRDMENQDSLTGVSNRKYFFERANQAFSRSKRYSNPLSIAEFDIDNFKQINDQNGHAVGDEVLKSLCNISHRLLRATDIFARLGGEKFAVLLHDTNLEKATVIVEGLRQAIADSKLSLSNGELNFTVSIGVAMLKPTDTCIESCLERAERAKYKAKQNGRNRVEIEA